MIEQIMSQVSQYGYLAIFLLIFLQEVGVPNPIPNELVLLFSGYLSFTGTLNFLIVILCAIAGDLLASTILYVLFYFFGKIIIAGKYKWLKLPTKKLESLSNRIQTSGHFGIFIGRLTPFIKGYASVISGLMHISPSKYSIILILSSIIWALVYVSFGYLIGPYWKLITSNSSNINYLILIIAGSIILVIVCIQISKNIINNKTIIKH